MQREDNDAQLQKNRQDLQWFKFAFNLANAQGPEAIRMPAGVDLAGTRFVGYVGSFTTSLGSHLEPALTATSKNVLRLVLQPYVQGQPLIPMYMPIGTGLVGPLQAPYVIGHYQAGDAYHNSVYDTSSAGPTSAPTDNPGPTGYPPTAPDPTNYRMISVTAVAPTSNCGGINNTWYLPRHVAMERGFMGNNNWITNGYYPATPAAFTDYLGTEGSHGLSLSSGEGIEMPLLNVDIYASEVPEFIGQTMEQAGFATKNSRAPGAWIHAACDNIWNAVRPDPYDGGIQGPTPPENGDFNNWGGQVPLGCPTVYPYEQSYTLGSYEGGIVTIKITCANGSKVRVSHCGQNQVKEFGLHTLSSKSNGSEASESIGKVLDAFDNPSWINETDYFFEPVMVTAGSMYKACRMTEIVSGADSTNTHYFVLRFVQPRPGLCALHPAYRAWTLADVGQRGDTMQTEEAYQLHGWGVEGVNCQSHWEVTFGMNSTSCGDGAWMGTVSGEPAWNTANDGVPSDMYNMYGDKGMPMFPASTYPSNAVISTPFADSQRPGYQGWNGVDPIGAKLSDGLNGSTNAGGFGTRGQGIYSFRTFPLYIPGGDQVQPTVDATVDGAGQLTWKNPLGTGAPFQPLMQQFISVVGGRRRTRAPNSVAQSLFAGMPQFEVVRLDTSTTDASVDIVVDGTYYYNLVCPNSSPLWPTSSPAKVVETGRVREGRLYAGAASGSGDSYGEALKNANLMSARVAQQSGEAMARGGHSMFGSIGDGLKEFGMGLLNSLNPFAQLSNAFENGSDLLNRMNGGPGTQGGMRGAASQFLAGRMGATTQGGGVTSAARPF